MTQEERTEVNLIVDACLQYIASLPAPGRSLVEKLDAMSDEEWDEMLRACENECDDEAAYAEASRQQFRALLAALEARP